MHEAGWPISVGKIYTIKSVTQPFDIQCFIVGRKRLQRADAAFGCKRPPFAKNHFRKNEFTQVVGLQANAPVNRQSDPRRERKGMLIAYITPMNTKSSVSCQLAAAGSFRRASAAIVTTGLVTIGIPFAASAQNFDYANFSTASLASTPLQLNGNAAAPVTGAEGTPVLRLTPAQVDQAGSAFSLAPVQLGNNASFSTAFAFQLTGGGGISDGTANPLGADGLVFVLNTVANNVGGLGQGVGYQGVLNSVGVKFDTWQDSVANGFPQDSDPNGNFVAMYLNGSTQTAGYVPYSPSNPTTESQYYTPSTSMKNGDIWYAWIDYNGVTEQLDVSLSDGVDVRPASPQLVATVNLSASGVLGSSPEVYAGFTSGTGGAYDNTDILNWQFNDTYAPIGVPEGGPGVVLEALTLIGVCVLGRRASRRQLA